MSAGLTGPWLSSHASSSAIEWVSSKTSDEWRANSRGSRSRATAKRSTAMPFTRVAPSGYSFFHDT